jgi:hypothetical protein
MTAPGRPAADPQQAAARPVTTVMTTAAPHRGGPELQQTVDPRTRHGLARGNPAAEHGIAIPAGSAHDRP